MAAVNEIPRLVPPLARHDSILFHNVMSDRGAKVEDTLEAPLERRRRPMIGSPFWNRMPVTGSQSWFFSSFPSTVGLADNSFLCPASPQSGKD